MKEKLELARDLMSHSSPSGDLTIVLERAVDLLIAELQKKKLGRTDRPQKEAPAKKPHVTRAARRKVVARDGFRCSFVAADGRRCDAVAFLEFDHEHPKAFGGGSKPENLRLLCRAHNRWAAEQVYGKTHISRAIAVSRRKAQAQAQGDGVAPSAPSDDPPRDTRADPFRSASPHHRENMTNRERWRG